MKQSYASLGMPLDYSTKEQARLYLGNVVWVIDGDEGSPVRYSITDCFIVQSIDEPSPRARFDNFKLRAIGQKSLLAKPVAVDTSVRWFKRLHQHFLTKQKFFQSLDLEPEIIRGLSDYTGVSI